MPKHPPPLRDLYPRITAFPTLLAAYRKASRGKRYRPDVLAFGANLEAELFQLQHELRSFTYAPGAYRQFMVREPKPRLVSAAPFRDRVVHHALIAVIAPPLERHFIPTSYANRKGYGTHRALRRFHRACREHAWVLHDIRLYFPSIDHRLLQAQLEQLIACPGTHWLLRSILAKGASGGPAIDAFPGDTLLTPLERPQGLPIGNLTSQFLANLHLNAIDHRLRVLPGIRACLRYVDDLALFADRPEPLRQALLVLKAELETATAAASQQNQADPHRHWRELRGFSRDRWPHPPAQPQPSAHSPGSAPLLPGPEPSPHQRRSRPSFFHELERPPRPWPHPAAAPTAVLALPLLRRPAAKPSPTLMHVGGSPSCFAAAPGSTNHTTAAPPTGTATTRTTTTTTQQRSASVLSLSPSTLHRQICWKGFQRACTKGPDPLR